jgi:imidazole glycerol-phosphate synthase subunit HisF
MLRSRITPCLLIQDGGLVKTVQFKDPKYVGDPINAVRIFNEKQVDELVVLDIDATMQKRSPNFHLIAKLASECRMPLCYGGGVNSLEDAKTLINLGVEKVALGAAVFKNPDLINEISVVLGNQSVVCILDVRRKKGLFSNSYELVTHNGTVAHKENIKEVIENIQSSGAGEVIINCVDNDGCMHGYDLSLVNSLKSSLKVPVTFLGGCGSVEDIGKLIKLWGTVGAAAGSFFVFKGKFKAVLISYISAEERESLNFNNITGE